MRKAWAWTRWLWVVIALLLTVSCQSTGGGGDCEAPPSGDPYSIIGVEKSAGKSQIIKAYRVLARKWHPDKNRGLEDAHAVFSSISQVRHNSTPIRNIDADTSQNEHAPTISPRGIRDSYGRGEA